MLCITNSNLFPQTESIIIEHISTQEGLSNRAVRCIMEDSFGFLWIGTSDGLNRYDGYEFVVYKSNIWDTTSLSSPIIDLLMEDEEGNIWIGSANGLNLYQRHSDSFVRFSHDSKNEYSISDNDNIEALLIDSKNPNYLWMGTDGGGLNLFDTELQRFYSFTHDPQNQNSISGDKVQSLYQDSFDDFWVGTDHAGLNRINLNSISRTTDGKYDATKFKSIIFERYLNDREDEDYLHSTSIASIYEDRSNTIWIISQGGVLIYNREADKLMPSPYFNSFSSEYKNVHIHEMLEDQKGVLWFGAHSRVFQLNPNTYKIKDYILNKEGIRADGDQGLCEDNAGNIWAATWDGIVRLYRNTPLFEHYYHNVDDPSLPASLYTYSILADHSGKVWIGTVAGLRSMQVDVNGAVSFINYFELHQINRASVWSLVEDDKGSIWAAVGESLMRIDPENNFIIQYKNDPEIINSINIQKKQNNSGSIHLLLDDNGNLWISAWGGGISKVSLEDLYSTENLRDVEFTNYFDDPNDPGNLVLNFIEDISGELWICTRAGGVINLDPETNKIKNYKQDTKNPNSLSINYANSVHEDQKGNIWIGTYGGGLNKFDRETESFTHYGIKEGLPSDIIQGIQEDDNGNLWVSTNRGITKFNLENNKFSNYEMQENEFSFHDKLTGKMYFGNDNGFIVFHPDSIKESSYVPPVVINKFTRYSDENDGEQIIDRTISAKDNIELSYKDDIISFEFAALSFDQNIKCKYAYKLEGFNNNWINLGTKREVTFTNLDPGDYNFKVKACNQDGIWCDNFASIQIYISPPWWSTWWAYGTYGLFFIGFLYGIRRFELNRRKEKEDKRILELENDRKTKELRQASKLQLSMLPKEIPVIPNLEIAAYMKTATEVGGDYYDFCRSEDGNYFTAVLGDATGHGMNAGMMVSISKGLFKNLAQQSDLKYVISQFNSSLLSMELQPMYMSLCFLRIIYNQLQLVGAGMPPSLIFQNKSNNIMEIESSGPPLGGFANFDYKICNYKLSSGDIILIMSDGFPERRNSEKKIIGWDKARAILTGMKNSTADEIVKEFVKASDEWGGEIPPDDDFTLLAIKVK